MNDEKNGLPQDDEIPEFFLNPEPHLQDLGPRFMEALELETKGANDKAREIFREILRAEPRLAEPRMELARIFLDEGRFDDAEEQAREALDILESGGQWNEDIPDNVMRGLAYGLLGEVLRLQAESDEVVNGDIERFEVICEESRRSFLTAADLDPDNEHARFYALHFGSGGGPLPALSGRSKRKKRKHSRR